MSFDQSETLERIAPSERSDERVCSDLLLYTLIFLFTEEGMHSVSKWKLHQNWETYLWLLKKRALPYEGLFFQDLVSGAYKSLDEAIWHLLSSGYVHYKVPEPGDKIHFQFYPKLIAHVRRRADPREWEIIERTSEYLAARIRKPRRCHW